MDDTVLEPPGPSSPQPGTPLELLETLRDLRPYLRMLAARHPAVEADDLEQETAARALRYGATFRSGAALAPWLRRIALNVYLDTARRVSAMQPYEGQEPEGPRGVEPELDQREHCAALLARLPERERAIVHRFHRLDQSIARIARELVLPAGTVKSILHRARRRLAEGGDES